MAKALEAASSGDGRELYSVIDQRARHAMISIVASRRAAAELIRGSYPAAERAAALAALGDAAHVEDAAGLFAQRCDDACRERLVTTLGAPRKVTPEGKVLHVVTTRGGTFDMYHGSDTWYGIVWNTEAFFRERERASAELEQVRKNVALYERQRALQAVVP